MKSRALVQFWRRYNALPPETRRAADKQYALWREDTQHGSVRFKRVGKNVWSARVTDDFRALATRDGDTWLWFWIGPHDEYERIIRG